MSNYDLDRLIERLIFFFIFRDEKTDAYLQAKEELEHKNSQYEKLRREVISFWITFFK